MALLVPAAWSPLLARTVSVAADVAEEVGGAAGRMMGAGANVSSSAARVFSAITDNTLNVAETIWEGIDLTNVSVVSSSGRLFFGGHEDPAEVLMTPEAQALMSLPSYWQQALLDISLFASPSRPVLEIHRHHFYSGSAYTALDIWLVWLDTGHVGVAWRAASVTYTARWANPLWDIAADVTAEHVRISELLQEAIQATMEKPDLSLTREALVAAPPIQLPSWPARAWRWAKRAAAWALPRAESGTSTSTPSAAESDDAADSSSADAVPTSAEDSPDPE